jgi:hypothetical protein
MKTIEKIIIILFLIQMILSKQYRIDYECFGEQSNSPYVCRGKGKCIDIDKCVCNKNYEGEDCQITTCGKFNSTDPNSCSGYGKCEEYNKCNCQSGYTGTNCEGFNCFGKEVNDKHVCSGNGKCIKGNECECINGYFGENCNQRTCDETNPCPDPPKKNTNNLFLLFLFVISISCVSGVCIGRKKNLISYRFYIIFGNFK